MKENQIYQFMTLATLLGVVMVLTTCKKSENLPDTVTDGDGNVYKTVTIGTQVWMKENLKTTKYNDGSAIQIVTDGAAWEALSTSGYCWYNNDITNKSTYGALYNWFVVDATSNGGKNVCPTGWHVPSDTEWTTLTTYLGGEDVAGGKLKEIGLTYWQSPNTEATNETGFTALPSGGRYMDGAFALVGGNGSYWSSSEYLTTDAYYRWVGFDSPTVSRTNGNSHCGFSVRCLKDNM